MIRSIPKKFKTNAHCKYILIILGAEKIKKNDSLVYFPPIHAKEFIQVIDDNIKSQFSNIFINSYFKFKFNDTCNYNNCRLIDINPINMKNYIIFQENITII